MSRRSTGTVKWLWSEKLRREVWRGRWTRGDGTRTSWHDLDPSILRSDEAGAKRCAASFADVARATTKDGPGDMPPVRAQCPPRPREAKTKRKKRKKKDTSPSRRTWAKHNRANRSKDDIAINSIKRALIFHTPDDAFDILCQCQAVLFTETTMAGAAVSNDEEPF